MRARRSNELCKTAAAVHMPDAASIRLAVCSPTIKLGLKGQRAFSVRARLILVHVISTCSGKQATCSLVEIAPCSIPEFEAGTCVCLFRFLICSPASIRLIVSVDLTNGARWMRLHTVTC